VLCGTIYIYIYISMCVYTYYVYLELLRYDPDQGKNIYLYHDALRSTVAAK
jgi:hypothetical protein